MTTAKRQFGRFEIGLLALAGAVICWIAFERLYDPLPELPPILPLSAETVAVVDADLPLDARDRDLLEGPVTDASYFGAYAFSGAEVFNATGLNSLATAENWVLEQCRSKAANPSGCRIGVRLLPRGYSASDGITLSPRLQKALAEAQKRPAIAAMAVNGFAVGGWSYGMKSRKAAIDAAVRVCNKSHAEKALPAGASDSECYPIWVTP